MDATLSTSLNVFQCLNVIHCHHSLRQKCLAATIIVTVIAIATIALPLPLHELVLIDAKEDKELAPCDMSAKLSL